uniref:hypothetical protein n=5 Tax=Pseudomonas aeruginosa TaxID=287 RepID=UPI001C4A4BBC
AWNRCPDQRGLSVRMAWNPQPKLPFMAVRISRIRGCKKEKPQSNASNRHKWHWVPYMAVLAGCATNGSLYHLWRDLPENTTDGLI